MIFFFIDVIFLYILITQMKQSLIHMKGRVRMMLLPLQFTFYIQMGITDYGNPFLEM
jgi:hypothetical protein